MDWLAGGEGRAQKKVGRRAEQKEEWQTGDTEAKSWQKSEGAISCGEGEMGAIGREIQREGRRG